MNAVRLSRSPQEQAAGLVGMERDRLNGRNFSSVGSKQREQLRIRDCSARHRFRVVGCVAAVPTQHTNHSTVTSIAITDDLRTDRGFFR